MIKRLVSSLLFCLSLSAAVAPLRTVLVDTNNALAFPTNLTSFTVGGKTVTNLTGTELTVTSGSLGVSTNVMLTSVQTLSSSQKIVHRQNTGNAGVEDVSGFPSVKPRPETVQIGCYIDPAAGVGFGMAAPVGANVRVGFVNQGNDSRINTSGTVREVEFYVPSTLPTNCAVKIHIWRKTDVRWELIGSSDDIRSLLAATNGVERVTLPNPIRYAEIGDCIGGELDYTYGTWGAGFHQVATPQTYSDWTNRDYYWAYSPLMESGAQWELATHNDGNTIPIRCYGDPPVVILLGDSRCAGYPGTRSLLNPTQQYSKDADMAWRLERIIGRPVRNVGVEGNDTAEMWARFTNDVISAKARTLVILPGAYNNFYSATPTIATYTNEVRLMIDSALTNGVQYVAVCSDYPFWDSFAAGTNSIYGVGWTCIQGQTSDAFSAGVKSIVKTYPSDRVKWIDLRPDLGQTRADWGDPYWKAMNIWDLKDLFYASPSDRLHLSPAGADQTMRTVSRELRNWLKDFPTTTQESRPNVLADAGDANTTVYFDGYPITVLPYATPLTGNKTVTLLNGAAKGDTFKLIRSDVSSYTINVNSLKTIPTNQPAAVEAIWDGSTWKLSGYQTLN